MIPQFILFISVFLILLFGVHALVYVSVVHFFSVESSMTRYILMTVLGFLSVSFLLASTMAHWSENIVTRVGYFAAGFWMGALVNIVLASLTVWLVVGVARAFSWPINMSLVGGVFFSLAALVSVYGSWNALHPRIQEVTVTIPGLPETWQGRKLVQLSDVHLGHVYQAGFLQSVVDKVNATHPKLVVITGDLFDGMDGRLESFVKPLDAIGAEKGVLFVNGNHETYLGTQKSFDILETTKVHILRDEVMNVDGVAFVGVSYPERGERKDVVGAVRKLAPQFADKPSVLLYHAPVDIQRMAETGINLQLSGHTHQGQQFPFMFITRLVHKGFDYGLYQIGNFWLYTSSGVGTWGPAMRIGTQSEIVVITLKGE